LVVRTLLISRIRARVVCCLALALIAANTNTAALAGTSAYFSASSTAPTGSMSTVRLDVSTSPSASGIFNVAANMLPGDFQIKTIDLVNNGTVGVAQQDFTYSLTSRSTGAGNLCSLLDSSDPPTCASPTAPSASATTGAALLLLRCTTVDAAIPLACDTQNVYATQVYPLAGAGTRQQISTPGGLARGAVSGVATVASYAIGIGGTNFTGGPLVVGSPFGIGGPDTVAGADSQSTGLAASRTDHLASVVYLPTQAGDALADQTSMLTFTWTASQRVGGRR
jgi:Camelysin metallo-endopeptidase